MQFYHYQITEAIEDTKLQQQMDVFLSIFFHKQGLYRFNYRKDFNGVYFSQTELRAIFNYRTYPEMVELAGELGIKRLDLRNKYGRPLYYFEPINETLECTRLDSIHPTTSRNLREARKRKKHQLSPEAHIVLENLKLLKFTCTKKQYLEKMKAGYPDYVSKKEANDKKPLDLEFYLMDAMKYWSRVEEFKKARGYDYLDFIWEDTFGGRLHSIITCCPSVLKESGYIQLAGGPIVCLDLHQSQPSILAVTLKEVIGKNTFSDTLYRVDDIYIEMKNRLKLPDRTTAKQALFKMIFGHPNDNASKLFLEMFPDAGAWINQLKSTFHEANPSWKKHSNLAFLMQRKESEMFRKIWTKLDSQDIIFLTVHDEVIVPDILETITTTRGIMSEIFKKYGLEKIKVKDKRPCHF